MLLLQALLAGLDSILDHLLKLDTVYSKDDICQPLAVQTLPVPLIRKVPESIDRCLSYSKHVLHCEAFDLWHSCNEDFISANVLKGIN